MPRDLHGQHVQAAQAVCAAGETGQLTVKPDGFRICNRRREEILRRADAFGSSLFQHTLPLGCGGPKAEYRQVLRTHLYGREPARAQRMVVMPMGQEDINGQGSDRADIRGDILQPVACVDQERTLRARYQGKADAHRVGYMIYARANFLAGEHGKTSLLVNMQRLYYCPYPVSKTSGIPHSMEYKA